MLKIMAMVLYNFYNKSFSNEILDFLLANIFVPYFSSMS